MGVKSCMAGAFGLLHFRSSPPRPYAHVWWRAAVLAGHSLLLILPAIPSTLPIHLLILPAIPSTLPIHLLILPAIPSTLPIHLLILPAIPSTLPIHLLTSCIVHMVERYVNSTLVHPSPLSPAPPGPFFSPTKLQCPQGATGGSDKNCL